MKTIVSNKQNWFNKISLTKDDKIYVGIDVHKKVNHIAIWLNDAEDVQLTGVLALLEPQAHVLNMTAEACFCKSKKTALQALRLDPVCAHLSDK